MTKAKKTPAPSPAKKSHHKKVSIAPPEVDSRPVAAFPDRSQSLPPGIKPVAGLVTMTERARSVRPGIPASGQQPKQLTPILTLHEVSGTHVLRIFDQSNINLVLGVAQLVKGGSLVVITPTDTKAFDLGPGSQDPAPSNLPRPRPQPEHVRSTPLDQAGPGEEETDVEITDDGDVIDPSDPMAETLRLARQQEDDEIAAGLRPPRSPGSSGSGGKKREPRNDVQPNSGCGRCQGTGQTMGGGRCPVCAGKGVIHRYGASPTPRR